MSYDIVFVWNGRDILVHDYCKLKGRNNNVINHKKITEIFNDNWSCKVHLSSEQSLNMFS